MPRAKKAATKTAAKTVARYNVSAIIVELEQLERENKVLRDQYQAQADALKQAQKDEIDHAQASYRRGLGMAKAEVRGTLAALMHMDDLGREGRIAVLIARVIEQRLDALPYHDPDMPRPEVSWGMGGTVYDTSAEAVA